MELKKNEKHDLEKKTPLFLSIGLLVALMCVTVAFEWKGEVDGVDLKQPVDPFEGPYIVIPATTISQPEPPKPQKINTVPKEITQPPIFVENTLPEAISKTIIDTNPLSEPDLAGAFTALPPEPVAPGVVDIVEHMPTFPGGEKAFYEYISKNIKYPNLAKRNHTSGKVFVQFIIDTDGSLIEVQAIKGIGNGCDEAAVDVLKKSPKWNPGKQRGRKVKVRMVLPIAFALN